MNPTLKLLGSKRSKEKYGKQLSSFAFNLRRYKSETGLHSPTSPLNDVSVD
jgi:hypothetical protein